MSLLDLFRSGAEADLNDLYNCYRLLLLREPDVSGFESNAKKVKSGVSVKELTQEFLSSKEFAGLRKPAAGSPASEARSKPSDQNPFWHYSSAFDPIPLMQRYARTGLKPTEGRYTNFLGVKVDIKFFPGILSSMSNVVEDIPWPNNWHADIAEFGAALRAVELSKNTFTAVELGCGWGCWLNCAGAAARTAGKSVKLIGVEGDEKYLGWAQDSLTENGFAGNFDIIHGVAGAKSGIALFPKQSGSGNSWGLQAIFHPSDDQLDRAQRENSHQRLNVVTFDDIAKAHGKVDLLHIDIQGAEADLIESCQEALARNVMFVLIGTHSREIEGRLEKIMFANGWILEMDRPAISKLEGGRHTLVVDGVQGWRNPKAVLSSKPA